MSISLANPHFLYLLLLIPIFFLIAHKKSNLSTSKPFTLYLRAILICLLILALSEPQIALPTRTQTILFLADQSASIQPQSHEKINDFIAKALATQPESDKAGIITFAENSIVEQNPDTHIPFTELKTSPSPHHTNIERALEVGLSLMPSDTSQRVVLLSDGNETIGKAFQQSERYKENNIPIDIVPIKPPEFPEVYIKDFIVPNNIYRNEDFNVQVNIVSTEPSSGTLHLYQNNTLIIEENVELNEGNNIFSFPQNIANSGFHRYRAEIFAEPDTITENNQAAEFVMVPGPQQVLLVGSQAGITDNLQTFLENHGIMLTHKSLADFPDTLEELHNYSTILLQDVPIRALSRRKMQLLQSFVQDSGRGLIATGGGQSFALGDYRNTILDSILPLSSSIEHEAILPSLALVIIIDKSGSMREVQPGTGGLSRIDIAREATIASVELLLSHERVGVIAFDTEAEWVLPIQSAENKNHIYDALDSLYAGRGGTRIYPALEASQKELVEEDTAAKHVILLSDGMSIAADFESISRTMREQGITISTVSIGDGADLELMSQIADWADGKAYFTRDFTTIPQILTTEVSRISRPYLVEEEVTPIPTGENPFTETINWSNAPKLSGFNRTTPKNLADVYLKAPDQSPLLAGWRYGLGRVLAFTSDMGQHYSANWLNWEEYNDFWKKAIQWVMPHQNNKNIYSDIKVSENQGHIIVNALDAEGNYLNFLQLTATVQNPSGNQTNFELLQTGSGRYEAEFKARETGSYMINVHSTEDDNPQIIHTNGAVVPFSPEYLPSQNGSELLTKLAESTDGRVLTSASEVFSEQPISFSEPQTVWHWLILLAIFLFLFDVASRIVNTSIFKQQ